MILDTPETANWLMSTFRHKDSKPTMKTREQRKTEKESKEEETPQKQAGKITPHIPPKIYDPYFLYLRSLIDFAYQLVDTTKGSAFMRTKYVGREMVAEMRIPGMKQPVLISMYDERSPEEIWKLLVAKANGKRATTKS